MKWKQEELPFPPPRLVVTFQTPEGHTGRYVFLPVCRQSCVTREYKTDRMPPLMGKLMLRLRKDGCTLQSIEQEHDTDGPE